MRTMARDTFVWLRTEIEKVSFERCGNEGMGGQKVIALDDLNDIIIRAEAKEILSTLHGWIPCGRAWPYPGEKVQVTYRTAYKGRMKGEPLCDAMAFIDENGNWHWDNEEGTLTDVEITAWKHPGEPHRENLAEQLKEE